MTRQPRRAFGGAFPRTNDAASRDIVFPDPTAARYRARRPSSAVRGAGKPQRSRGPDAVGARRVEHFRARSASTGIRARVPARNRGLGLPPPNARRRSVPGTGTGTGTPRRRRHARDDPGERTSGPDRDPSRRGKPPAAEKRRRYAALRASLTEALTRVKTSVDAEAVEILESAVSAGRAAGNGRRALDRDPA